MMKGSLNLQKLPKIKVKWIRGRGTIPFHKPITLLNLGMKDSGKSTLLECCALRYLEKGKIYDLFGSRDNEGLAWGRVLPKNEILFVTGDSVEIKGRWHMCHVKNLSPSRMKRYRVVLSVSAFYGDLDEEFHGLNEIIFKNLYKKTHWNIPEFLMVREASNFIYARIKLGKNQDTAKADFIYLLRESRHMGYAIGVDTIRWTSLDKEVRDLADFTFIKRVGTQGLPRAMRFVYAYVDPASLMNPPPSAFVVVSGRGPIGVGSFEYVKWHKKEKDDLLTELKITPKYGEVPYYGNDTRNWVTDPEHVGIIEKRRRGGDRSSMHKIAEDVKRSAHTVQTHIKNHNAEIRKRGYCLKCRRMRDPYAQEEV